MINSLGQIGNEEPTAISSKKTRTFKKPQNDDIIEVFSHKILHHRVKGRSSGQLICIVSGDMSG